jgi:ketosteroid isomerase-like protein
MTPETFPRLFAAAFAAQDSEALAAFFAADASLQSLTGLWAESPEEIEAAFAAEAAGIFARARLVTGKGSLRPLNPFAALLRQRYTVSGAVDESGAELPRFATILVAVLERNNTAWLVQSLSFTALP